MKNIAKRYTDGLVRFAENRFHAGTWWLAAMATFGLARVTQAWLDGFYARSEFPVPFYFGQTRFDGEAIKGFYQVLIEKGTLDIYVQTQLVDYVFMATTFLSFFCLAAAVMRTTRAVYSKGVLVKIARLFVWLAPTAAIMDALENLVSFVMLADPTGFANWLAIPYSSFAVLKFTIFGATYLWVLIALLACLLGAAWKLSRGKMTQPEKTSA
jgi:hypothetical protein